MPDESLAPEGGAKPDITRGGCLTTFLVVLIVVNALVALPYFLYPGAIAHRFPRFTHGLLLLMGAGAVLNIILALLVWNWRRVGVYGFVAVSLVVFAVNLYVGVPILQAVLGLLGIVILAFLVRPRWARFT